MVQPEIFAALIQKIRFKMFSFALCFLLFCCAWLGLVAAQNCKSIEYQRSDPRASTPQPNHSALSRSVATQIIGGKAPCNRQVCSSCISSVSFPLVTATYGPHRLRLTAHRGTIALMDRVITDIEREQPDLLPRIGSRGGLCCRLVRRASGGCGSSWSMHSFGMAFDLKIDNYNDAHGDNCVHKPLIELHKFMARHGFYWGKDFRTEDAMHWEVSTQTARGWLANGIPTRGSAGVPIPPPVPAIDRCKAEFGARANCKHVSMCGGTTARGFCPGDANNLCCHSEPAPVTPTAAPPTTAPPTNPPTAPVEQCIQRFGASAVCTDQCDEVSHSGLCSGGRDCCTPDLCKRALGSSASCVTSGSCQGLAQAGFCSAGTVCCAPPTDSMPAGALAPLTASSDSLDGWACDADSVDVPIDVHIYINGLPGSRTGVLTSLLRDCPDCLGKDVPSNAPNANQLGLCGCADAASCKVGFSVPLAMLSGIGQFEGASVPVYAFAINTGSGNPNPPLQNSPQTATIPAGTLPPTPPPMQNPTNEPLPACLSPAACDSSLPCCELCTTLPSGSPCSEPTQCKEQAVCDGINSFCPSRQRKPVGTPCEAPTDDCHQSGQCTLDGTCFALPIQSATCAGCRNDADCNDGNPCSKDTCDNGACKYGVDLLSIGAECRRVANVFSCDLPEFCTGDSIECPPDVGGCDHPDDDAERGGDDDELTPPLDSSATASVLAATCALISIATQA